MLSRCRLKNQDSVNTVNCLTLPEFAEHEVVKNSEAHRNPKSAFCPVYTPFSEREARKFLGISKKMHSLYCSNGFLNRSPLSEYRCGETFFYHNFYDIAQCAISLMLASSGVGFDECLSEASILIDFVSQNAEHYGLAEFIFSIEGQIDPRERNFFDNILFGNFDIALEVLKRLFWWANAVC